MKSNLQLVKSPKLEQSWGQTSHERGQSPNLKVARNVQLLAWVGIAALILIGAVGASSFSSLKTQYSIMQFLPPHHPALEMDHSIRDHFHLVDRPTFIAMIELAGSESGTWLTQERIKKLSDFSVKVGKISGVHEVISLANVKGMAGDEGSINVGEVIRLTPESQWHDRVLDDKLLAPALISQDARSAMIYVELEEPNVELMMKFETEMKEVLANGFKGSIASLGGVPAVQTELGLLLNKELRNFLLFTVLACAITLILIFRSISTLFIPLALTGFANVMVIAAMAWSGLPFTILSSTIPILVFITVVSLVVHTLLRYHEDHSANRDSHLTKWQLIVMANRAVWLPNLLGALTTCVGFLTLLSSEVPLIRNYGLAVALAVMVSWLLTSLGLLPMMILMPHPVPRAWVNRPARWALLAMRFSKPVSIGIVALCCIFVFVGRHLDWTGRLFDDLPAGQEARTSTESIDRSMGGVLPLEMEIKFKEVDAWKNPQRITRLDQVLGEIRGTSGVGSALSVPEFLRASNPGGASSALPTSQKAIAETYFLYSFAEQNPLAEFLTDQNRNLRVSLKLHDLPSNEVQALVTSLKLKMQAAFPDGQVEVGGMGAYVHTINNEISNDLIFGFWQALIIIAVILAVIFRSLRWALVACVPNLIPPIALLGFIAVTHTPVKPGVAIIFSIALGLAFNNTVYLLNRLRDVQRLPCARPITRAFHLEGNPCLVSTLVIMMGFSVFMFSYFPLNRTFGACMIVSILAGLIGDLVFLPAVLAIFPQLLIDRKMRKTVEPIIFPEVVVPEKEAPVKIWEQEAA